MKLLVTILFAISIWSCKEQNLNRDSEQVVGPVKASDTRPQETGEGLPGYMYCASAEAAEETSLNCRLQNESGKVDLANEVADWSIDPQADVQVSTSILASNEPWHVRFGLQGTLAARQEALDKGNISLVLNNQVNTFSIKSAVSTNLESLAGDFKLLFGPGASGRNNDWVGLNLDSPTSTPLESTLGSPVGTVFISLTPEAGGSLSPEGPSTFAIDNTWSQLATSGISSLSGLDISGTLPDGTYKITVVLGGVFITEAVEITATNPTVGETATASPLVLSGEPSAENFVQFEVVQSGQFSISLSAPAAGKIVVHGLIIQPI